MSVDTNDYRDRKKEALEDMYEAASRNDEWAAVDFYEAKKRYDDINSYQFSGGL